MLIKNFLLPGVVVPVLCSAVAVAASAWWGRRSGASVGGSLAIGAAFTSAFVALTGWPRFPPVESTQRLFYWVVVIAVIGFVWGRFKKSVAVPWPICAGAVAFLLWGMLKAPIENTWSSATAALWIGSLLIGGFAMARAVAASLVTSASRPALEAAAVRLAILGGSAVALGLSGTARLAQLMGAVACGVLVVELMARMLRRRPWLAGDALVLVMAVLGLLLGGYFYAELEAWPALLLASAVLMLGLGSRAASAWRWLPILPLFAALALAGWSFLQQEEDPYDYYGWCPDIDGSARPLLEGNTARRPA